MILCTKCCQCQKTKRIDLFLRDIQKVSSNHVECWKNEQKSQYSWTLVTPLQLHRLFYHFISLGIFGPGPWEFEKSRVEALWLCFHFIFVLCAVNLHNHDVMAQLALQTHMFWNVILSAVIRDHVLQPHTSVSLVNECCCKYHTSLHCQLQPYT